MAVEPKKKLKYSVHLASSDIVNLPDFVTDKALAAATEIPLRGPLAFDCKLYVKPPSFGIPSWARKLDEFFQVDGAITSAASAALLLFKCKGRVMACAYGHGHTMLDDDKRDNDFGLLVAANSLSDENVKLVEKANLGSVIRDATQAVGIARLQEFNVDRALSLVRKLSGAGSAELSSLSGASSLNFTSEKDIDRLHELGGALLDLRDSKAYQKSAFAILDKIKPVTNVKTLQQLDAALVTDLNGPEPSFELGIPEIDTEPVGYVTVSGLKKRVQFPDISLSEFLNAVGTLASADDLHKHRIATHSIDGTHKLKEWSFYRGLVGSLAIGATRYALNEGKWYSIENALRDSANAAFAAALRGLDTAATPWPIVGKGKKGKTETYEEEKLYNKRYCLSKPVELLLFDRLLFTVPNTPGSGIEICDVFDVPNKRLVHIKKSGRRSSVISHFLNQGMNSAKVLKTYPTVKDKFIDAIEAKTDKATADAVRSSFPHEWTVEYKFGDFPNVKGDYTIPFFSRVAFDETKREIEAWGYKAVEISFIRLSKSTKKPTP